MPDADPATDEEPEARAFWSGTISFGLVSVPVQLVAAQRARPTSMRWLSPDGAPLRREFFCSTGGETLERDDLVRGVELEDGSFVPVEDDELEALEPERTRDIDLRRFVPRAEVDVATFERSYYLTPASDSPKAYRLLAAVLEETDRVGIATLVLRGREHLVSIIGRGGVLRMETLRWADELRPPEAAGLPVSGKPDPAAVARFAAAIEAGSLDALPEELLADEAADQLRALAEAKWKKGEGVVELADEVSTDDDAAGDEPEDIVAVLRRSLGASRTRRAGPTPDAPTGGPGKRRLTSHQARRSKKTKTKDLADLTKEELYERAQAEEIAGRSEMTKEELIAALGG